MSHGRSNAKLRKALLDRLEITQQALSARAQKRNRLHQLSTPESIYLIANEEGLKLADYMGPEELERARKVIGGARVVPVSTGSASKSKSKSGNKAKANEVRFTLPTGKIYTDPELSKKIGSQAREMSQHYSVLYLLENSIRTLFREILLDEYGKDWWNKNFNKGSAKGARQEIERRMATREERRRWHQKASDCPLDYASLEQLKVLMLSKGELLFPVKLGIEKENFSVWMGDLVSIRNVLCHMNPLDKTSIKDLSVKYDRWIELCRAYKKSKD